MKKIFYFFSALILLSSCRSMGSLYAPVYYPAIVKVPEHIKKIGIVNRSLAVEGGSKKAWATLEAIVSGEGLLEDKNGSMAAMMGAEVQLRMDTLVTAQQLKNIVLPGNGGGLMNPPLEQSVIDSLCSINGFDALLVLEAFDTDQQNSQTTNALRDLANSAMTGNVSLNNLQGPSYTNVRVKMSWRFYDYQQKTIVDEATLYDYFGSAKYNTYDLGDFAKRDGIQSASYIGGRVYVNRLYPGYITVYRDFYRRNGMELKMGARMMDVGDLQGAKNIWMAATSNPKRKIAGCACFNTAVGLELSGDLNGALEWAQKAYSMYRLRRAISYAAFLNQRLQNPNLR